MATSVQRRAKQPTTPLAGPYGHPFHPMLVPIPIGAWVTSLVFDVASHWSGEAEVFTKASFWLIAVGILGAVAAAAFGLLDLLAIPRGTKAFRLGLTHMSLNLITVVLYAISFAVRRGQLDDGAVDVWPLVLSAVALAVLAVSGWLGGEMSYRYGVRVADEGKQAEGYSH